MGTKDLKYVTIGNTASCDSITSGYVTTSNSYTTTAIPYTTTWYSQPMTIKAAYDPITATIYNPEINIEKMKEYVEGKKVVKKEEKLDPRLVKVNKEIEELKKKTTFTWIKEYVPEKVYGFKFKENKEYKTICADEDTFNLEFAFALATVKHIYSNTLTTQGLVQRANDYFDFKNNTKEIKNGIKLFHKLQEKEALEEQIKAEKKHRHDKLVAKKIEKKERAKQTQYEIIRSAIEDAKS